MMFGLIGVEGLDERDMDDPRGEEAAGDAERHHHE